MNGQRVRAAGAVRECAPAALDPALLGGPSTSPLGVFVLRSLRCLRVFCLWALLVRAIAPVAYAEEAGRSPLPKLKTSEPTADLYPPASRRLHEEGRVLVEFAISPEGRVSVPPTVLLAEPEDAALRLQEAALSYVRHVEFDVPSNWETSGGPHQKFRFSFVFLLRPCRETEPCMEPAPYFGADKWFTITAPPLDVSVVQPAPRVRVPKDPR